jgi:hypothetical protein
VVIALGLYRPNIDFLLDQLRSISGQSYKNWQCLIGADSDLSKLKGEPGLQRFFKDDRFHWRQNPERYGYAINFQNLIRAGLEFQPDVLAFCDQDDVWKADKLEVCLSQLKQHPQLQLLMHDMYHIRGREFIEQSYRDLMPLPKLRVKSSVLLAMGGTFGCSMVFRPDLAQRFVSLPGEINNHDLTIALLASAENSLDFYDKPLSYYRLHEHNTFGICDPDASGKKVVEQWRNAVRTGGARFKFKKALWDLVKTRCRRRFRFCDLLLSSPDLGLFPILYGLLIFPFSRFCAKEWMATGMGKLMTSLPFRR